MSIDQQTTPSAAVALLQQFYQAYQSGDLDRIRNEILAPDIVWTIAGRHPMAGPKRGADEIMAYFDQMGTTNVTAEVLYMSGDDTQAVDIHRGWGDANGVSMDMLFALYATVEGGRIKTVSAFASDQSACDSFFWAAFQLAPIPDRLKKS